MTINANGSFARSILQEAQSIGFEVPWECINTREEAIEHAKVAKHLIEDWDNQFIYTHQHLNEVSHPSLY